MKEKPPRSSGVYQILCKPTGKIYIGSAVNFPARWSHHRNSLRRGVHRNIHLQNAWDKYGEESFEFSVLEFVERIDLLRAEQAWIDKTRCIDRRIGFNLYPIAGSPGDTHAQVWKGFIDPNGKEITITNLYDFCRRNGFNFTAMRSLAIGKSKLKSHKGWTHKNSVRQRDYVKTYNGFIDPDGCLLGPITNLAAFCRERGLDNTHMIAVAHGRICSHRGWTHSDGRQRQGPKTHIGFINPLGQPVTITNLKAFCRDHDLRPVRMYSLISGKRKSHKGWTWRNNDKQAGR
jgi:group I intron endonuclease